MTSGSLAGRPADILAEYLDAPLRAAGFDLEDVSVRRAGRQSVVAVTVDREGPLDLDAIAEASRIVSETLDAQESRLPGALSDAYTLEVTSRGADAPLLLDRHWRRAVGRLVVVKLIDGNSVSGRVLSADGEQALVAGTPKPHKPGAKVSAKTPTEITVRYADVQRAVVELEFTSLDGSDDFDDLDGPEDPDVDELDEFEGEFDDAGGAASDGGKNA